MPAVKPVPEIVYLIPIQNALTVGGWKVYGRYSSLLDDGSLSLVNLKAFLQYSGPTSATTKLLKGQWTRRLHAIGEDGYDQASQQLFPD